MDPRSSNKAADLTLDSYGGMQLGDRPCRSHDYVFVAERGTEGCALVVGREMRDDWEERSLEEDTPAAMRILARFEQLCIPLANGRPAQLLEHFARGFRQTLTRTQDELQRGAKDRAGEATSLTLTLAYIDRLRLYVGHVGDGRCYVMRDQRLHRITTDHTVVPATLEGPTVSDPMICRKVLNVVGGFSDDLEAETLAMDLQIDDVVLLCTPGVDVGPRETSLGEALRTATLGETSSLETLANAVLDGVAEQGRNADRAIALARFVAMGTR